jgi:hypothetical protein
MWNLIVEIKWPTVYSQWWSPIFRLISEMRYLRWYCVSMTLISKYNRESKWLYIIYSYKLEYDGGLCHDDPWMQDMILNIDTLNSINLEDDIVSWLRWLSPIAIGYINFKMVKCCNPQV